MTRDELRVGDIVVADQWLENVGGKLGIIVFVQSVKYCISARVLFNTGVSFIRLDNLRLIHEAR